MPTLTDNGQFHIVFCTCTTVVPARHSTAHRLDPWNQYGTGLCSGCFIPGMCKELSLWQDITDRLCGPHPARAQWPRHKTDHQSQCSAKIRNKWSLPPVKGNAQLQLILLILWNSHWWSYLQCSRQLISGILIFCDRPFNIAVSVLFNWFQQIKMRLHNQRVHFPHAPTHCADHPQLNEAPSLIKWCWWLSCFM
jgi:hypothetical protein